MNAERQLIGSLLIDQSRYEDISYISSEMFSETLLGAIFSVFEHSGNKEVNPLVIASKIGSESFLGHSVEETLQTLVLEHDSSVSDRYCADLIFNEYKVRKINEYLNHTKMDAHNIDQAADELKSVIEGLEKPSQDTDVAQLSELVSLKGNYFNPKNEKQIKIGISEVDKAVGGFDKGDVTIIAARPAVGKSAFALQIIRKFGRDGLKTGYFNLEMAQKQIYERAVAAASGIDLNRIRLGINFLGNEQMLFEEGNKKIAEEKNVYIVSGTQTIKSIRQQQRKYDFDIIVIDYLQLINPDGKRNGNRVAEVGDISRGLKAIARDFNIPVIALSQLNRASEMNATKEPTMAELRESGDLEQDASTIILMWNSNAENRNEKTIKVEKSRNGTNDRVTLYFDGKHMSFSVNDYAGAVSSNDIDDIPFD